MVNSELGADEDVDRVSGQPAVTAWKRAARRHQHEWRQAHGWPPGVRPQRKPVDPSIRIGNRVDLEFARRTNANFLTEAAVLAVEQRLRSPQAFQTLDETRLYSDLLSSMPMCFNLFGPLATDPELATRVAHRWFPDRCPIDATVTVDFEWSPGRSQAQWLDDRTAFDVKLDVRTRSGRSLIGIETKYHEHAAVSATRRRDRETGILTCREPKPRYIDVTEQARLFDRPDWLSLVWGTPVEQIWRDHLLAFACRADRSVWQSTSYVLVGPGGNPAWREAASAYASLSPHVAETFEFRTLEDLIALSEDLLPHAQQFRSRYLDVAVGSAMSESNQR